MSNLIDALEAICGGVFLIVFLSLAWFYGMCAVEWLAMWIAFKIGKASRPDWKRITAMDGEHFDGATGG